MEEQEPQNWGPTSSGVGYRIQIRGTANASNDATLSTWSCRTRRTTPSSPSTPPSTAATLEYGATVGRGVGEITIIPTPNDTDADHEVQDGDGAALTDADTTQDEFQVSIARGLNAIQVEVTAEDATTQTYTVTVTRPRILVSSTGQTSGGSAETGNRNGNQTKHAQKFTTGSNPAGYTLDEVRIHLGTNGNAAAPVITVNSGSGNNPGAVLYTMTNPATITDETTNTFTAYNLRSDSRSGHQLLRRDGKQQHQRRPQRAIPSGYHNLRWRGQQRTFRLETSTTPAELEPQAGQPHQAT